jgi:hypothetical protein
VLVVQEVFFSYLGSGSRHQSGPSDSHFTWEEGLLKDPRQQSLALAVSRIINPSFGDDSYSLTSLGDALRGSLAAVLLAAAGDHVPDPTEVRLLRPGCYPAQARAAPANKGRGAAWTTFRRDSWILEAELQLLTSNLGV